VVEAHKILFREHQKLKIELADLAANEYTDYFIKKESQKVDKIKDWDFHQDLREQGWSGINVYVSAQCLKIWYTIHVPITYLSKYFNIT